MIAFLVLIFLVLIVFGVLGFFAHHLALLIGCAIVAILFVALVRGGTRRGPPV